MTLREYVEYLVYVRDIEKDIQKFDRILNYNSKIDKFKLFDIDFDYTKIPKSNHSLTIMIEEERELSQGNPGSSFGEMALIKNEPRNASIIALERCVMIYIEKNDYTKIVKDIEEQRINKELASFKLNYPFLKYWPPSKCFRLLSGFITEEYKRNDYVYKQNDVPNGIYLIKEGVFEVFANYNFDWYEKFINYIHDTSISLINDIDNPMEWKEDKITKKLNDAYKGKTSPFIIIRDPIEKTILSNKSNKEINNENIDIAHELESELLQNKKQFFKAIIQKLESPNIFGLLEVFELKHRICSIKCISQKGVVMRFPLLEFLQLIPTDKKNQFYLQQRIFNEKKTIIAQMKNRSLAKLNFMKNEDNKNFFISKDFFINNGNLNRPTNKVEFKRQYIDQSLTTLRSIKISHDINLNPKLHKSKSSHYFNIPKIANNQLLSSKNLTQNEEYNKNNNLANTNDIPLEEKKKGKNGIILGFKNSVIKLSKEKLKLIRSLFPKETIKKSFSPDLNIKQINNSDKEYIKYLENNIELSKTPIKLRKIHINGAGGMTGKNYISLETSKFIYKLNKYNNKTKSTNESKKNSDLFLPYINNNLRSPITTDNDNNASKIRLINYKVNE